MPASCPIPGWARVAHVLGVTALLASAKKCFVLVFLKKYLFHFFWLCLLLVVTRGSLLPRVLSSCGVQTQLPLSMWHLSSPTRD